MIGIRAYEPGDEQSWLRCRVLGFLDTSYFDDVWPSRPRTDSTFELVAVDDATGHVVAILDATIDDEQPAVVIDTVVVHPDFRRRGLADSLLAQAIDWAGDRRLPVLQAWTRDDAGPNAWYAHAGFAVTWRYLHVYASTPAEAALLAAPTDGVLLRLGFAHVTEPAAMAWARATFRRVHECRRYDLSL